MHETLGSLILRLSASSTVLTFELARTQKNVFLAIEFKFQALVRKEGEPGNEAKPWVHVLPYLRHCQ